MQNYFQWLSDLVDVNTEARSYFLLYKDLFSVPFRVKIANDINRAEDGKDLRDIYFESIPFPDDLFHRDCSFLEMMIGLAYRMEFIMDGLYDNKSYKEWFFILLANLKLDVMDDENYETFGGNAEVLRIVNRVNDRTYYSDGTGGLFPLSVSPNRKHDQRRLEIWYQMQAFLLSEYPSRP